MIRLLKVEVEGKKLRWLYFMNVILFFFFLALALLRISTNMNIKKTSFGKRKQRWIQGEGQERRGGGDGPPPIRTVGTFISYLKLWFLQRQDGILLLNFQSWNIYLAYSGFSVRKKKWIKDKTPLSKIPGSNSASLPSDMLTTHITLWPSGRF